MSEPGYLEGNRMLVLSRKKGDKIIIGDNITIVITDIRGDKVNVGIDAPRNIIVNRGEVHLAKLRNQQSRPDLDMEPKVLKYLEGG